MPDFLTIKHVAALLSGASVSLAALLAYRIGGRTVMIATALVGIFHFGHLVQAAAPNSEPLYGLLVVTVLLAAARVTVPGGLVGAAAAAAMLVRAEFALAAGLLAAWIALQRGDGRRYHRAGWFTVGLVLTLLPTTILNWRHLDDYNRARAARLPGPLPRFAPVTSYGAFNFANANHDRANGGFNWDLPGIVPPDGEAADLLEQGQLDFARAPVYQAYVDGYGMGLRWIAANPQSAVTLFARKLAIALSVFDYGYLLDNRPVDLRGIRRPVDQIDLKTSWITWLHAALAAAGVVIALRTPAARLLLIPVATLLASAILFFGYVRLGVAYLPVIWILQALAVAAAIRTVGVSQLGQRRAERAAAALVVALVVYDYTTLDRARPLMVDGLVDETGRLVEDQPLTIERVR